jgi:phosphohistidine phosphatase
MPNQADRERVLTQRGVREALLIGNYLYQEKTAFDVVFASVAARANATAHLIADAMKFDPALILEEEALFEASTRTFFQYITQLDDKYTTVLCVAHNPSISYLAESLTKAEIGDMPPAGLAIIKFNTTSWAAVGQGTGDLHNYIFPEMLSGDWGPSR